MLPYYTMLHPAVSPCPTVLALAAHASGITFSRDDSDERSTGSGFGPDAYQYLQDCLGWEGSARLRPAWRWATVLTFFRGRRHEVVGAESVHAKDISGVRWLGQ